MINALVLLFFTMSAQARPGDLETHMSLGFPNYALQASSTKAIYSGYLAQGYFGSALSGGQTVKYSIGGVGELMSLENSANTASRAETVRSFGYGVDLNVKFSRLSLNLQYLMHNFEHYQVGNFSHLNTYSINIPRVMLGYSLGKSQTFSVNYSFINAKVASTESGYNYPLNWSGSTIWLIFKVDSLGSIKNILK